MRIFPHFNASTGAVCPVCATGDDKETILIPIAGTQEDNIIEAAQFHTECIEANWNYIRHLGVVVFYTREHQPL
jgi:hypothetical protein